jgi:hypothetical protein
VSHTDRIAHKERYGNNNMRWRDLPAPECIAAEGQKQIL